MTSYHGSTHPVRCCRGNSFGSCSCSQLPRPTRQHTPDKSKLRHCAHTIRRSPAARCAKKPAAAVPPAPHLALEFNVAHPVTLIRIRRRRLQLHRPPPPPLVRFREGARHHMCSGCEWFRVRRRLNEKKRRKKYEYRCIFISCPLLATASAVPSLRAESVSSGRLNRAPSLAGFLLSCTQLWWRGSVTHCVRTTDIIARQGELCLASSTACVPESSIRLETIAEKCRLLDYVHIVSYCSTP